METLKINGEKKEFFNGVPASISELLKQLNINASTVVAEVDGQIVERSKFAETKLADGQTIELVRFVGGG